MIIQTKHFGERDIQEEMIVQFEEGIFGFEEYKKFIVLYNNEEGKNTFCWLQSIEEVSIALPIIDPVQYFSDYNPEIAGSYITKIGELIEEDLNLYSVVVVPDQIEKMTTNLKAPIVINIKTKKGIQVIVEDEGYQLRHNLYEQIQKNKGAGE